MNTSIRLHTHQQHNLKFNQRKNDQNARQLFRQRNNTMREMSEIRCEKKECKVSETVR